MKRIRSTKTTMLLAALLTAGAVNANAPAGDDMLSLEALLSIKLQTGSFLELDLAKSPLSMTVISKEKVGLSGARNLSELLEVYVPGFQYMYNKWNGVLWGMRGVANDRNTKFIVLVNGHKMNTEARDGFFQETSMGLFGDVERIEVLRGPAGLVYGSGAIAGIVNIVTRTADKNGSEIVARAGTWSNHGNMYTSVQGTVFGKMAEGQSLVATAGWESSNGVGNGVSRIYGNGSWPFPSGLKTSRMGDGVPVDGSAHAVPLNWKGAVDFDVNGLRLYARATHSVQEAGGFFIKDPWPGVMGAPAATDGDALIDGRNVPATDPFWSGTESWNTSRREYVADNILVDARYEIPIGENDLKLHAGFDGNTARIQREMRPGYEANAESNERNSFLEETFGERRYTLGATFLFKTIEKLQLAVGAEQRFDDIGDDLSGRNSQQEKATHKIVSDILYSNTAVFTEGWYDVMPHLGVDFGLRWDGHTRTIDNGGTLNGKLAGVYEVVPGHTVKLIFQSSSNNGSADNYEYNRNNFNDAGVPYVAPHFEKPTEPPGGNSNVIYGVTTEQLHELKPEKIYSFELTSSHDLGSGVSVAPSVSYNMVRDLFAWNQTMFRVVNVGEYNHLDADLQVDWTSKFVDVGANHAMQMIVNTDVDEQAETFTSQGVDKTKAGWYDSTALSGGGWTYYPVINGTVSSTVNPVKEQISADGSNFLSLNTHVSKMWVNVKPLSWLTVHTDVRVFWGMWGRDSIYNADEKLGYNYLSIQTDPSVKWNLSAHARLPDGWEIGVYGYDLLGETKGGLATHAIRWQQMGDAGQRDLYAVDLRSYAIDVKKSF
ncbi:MAG TPA: TonB-dependent receptor plug domain-containing protein [Fibrobacteria bacterium]|nr:TonB-dependent receptor plug domain-containing protein [Fibrobacteria bacterium]